MARAKKTEGATLTIDVDSFVRTRDSVVTGLATLQDAIQTLSTAYIKHTNAVLGEHGAGLDIDSALAKLGENPLLKFGDLHHAASPAKSVALGGDASGDKKERKKRQHDPNAPKRPLTPFFLYMQTARPIIAADLGADVAKGAVSTEGTRRWGAMEPHDKQLWTNAYKDNLRLYNARMHSYKAGNPDAKDMTDAMAAEYADEKNITADAPSAQLVGESAAAAAAAVVEVEEDVDADAEGEPEREPTPPPKTPKGKARKGKATKNSSVAATPATVEAIVPPASTSSSSIVPAKVEKEKSPDRKRKRSSKKVEEPEEIAVETPKSSLKPRKKKAKGDA